MDSAERVEEFRTFLQRGDLGYYAYLDRRVVHRAWVRTGPTRVPTYLHYAPLQVPGGDAYIHYCETAPAARGLGLYPAVLAHIVADLRARGTNEITIITTLDNRASRRGIEKAGFAETRRVTLIFLLGVPVASSAPRSSSLGPPHG